MLQSLGTKSQAEIFFCRKETATNRSYYRNKTQAKGKEEFRHGELNPGLLGPDRTEVLFCIKQICTFHTCTAVRMFCTYKH
ncbi:hypothetical protein KCU64_g45, partial [Aureobasidium melanogenum]